MRLTKQRLAVLAAGGAAATAYAVVAAASPTDFTPVPSAQPKAAGIASPNYLPPELAEAVVAQGSQKLENGTAQVPYYGYDGDGPMVPAPGAVQQPSTKIEATKTEPDKNTYLVLHGQSGADPGYNYGGRFLYQGHEGGAPGYLTRINLDADGPHRVTLLATTDIAGSPLPNFDGSTWDPWAQRLLFTAEKGNAGGVWQATLGVPSQVEDISGSLGRGGYEAIQNDSLGNVYVVEDVGGPKGTVNTHARQPNSFLYRFVPADPANLKAGKLQVLQVASLANPGQPIVFRAGQVDADIKSQDTKDLNSYGKVFDVRWVTIHDTTVNGTAPFDANALAKAKGGTPFKRPENGAFRPGTHFTQFYFDATGDTDLLTEAGADYGGFGALFKVQFPQVGADVGRLTLFYKGDPAHSGFDNVSFLSRDKVAFVEDAGDTLHAQRNALDSAFVFDAEANYAAASTPAPARLIAEGRDASATYDSPLNDARPGNGFQNDGDNEITGFHVSDGDARTKGILGAKNPEPWQDQSEGRRWRVFWTQQHGDNVTYEVVRQNG